MSQTPKVWSKFSVTKDSVTTKFQIIEATKDQTDDLAQLMYGHFVTGETLAKAAGIAKSKEAFEEYKLVLLGLLNDPNMHIVICCVDNDDEEIGELVGASLMALTKKSERHTFKFQPQTKEHKKFVEIIVGLMAMYDLMVEQNVDQFYDGRGVVVHSKYRGLGLSNELVKTRRLICRELGVPLTAALMTAYGTQKAAERDGWETVKEYNYEELGKMFDVTFDKNGPPVAKLMIARA